MSVDSLEEPLEATVSPVQVNPFGNAQAHDQVVLWPLSQKKIIVLQDIIGLKERRGAVRKTLALTGQTVLLLLSANKVKTLVTENLI